MGYRVNGSVLGFLSAVASACTLVFTLAVASGGLTAAEARDCPVNGADATTDALKAAPTCAAAAALYHDCSWGSSMDVQFGSTVIEKCEAEFDGRLSKKDKSAYERSVKRCIRKYAHREGTLYLSFAASCSVDVARDYAKRFGKPKPEPKPK